MRTTRRMHLLLGSACVLPALALATFSGCEASLPCADNQLSDKIDIDLSDVSGFVIAQGGPASTTAESGVNQLTVTPALYAVSSRGTLTPLTFWTNVNHGREWQVPQAIYDTPKYVFFGYQGLMRGSDECTLVPMRKSDGALFCIPGDFGNFVSPAFAAPDSVQPLQTDATGNIVWISAAATWRIDLTDPANPKISKALDLSGEEAVNALGDAFTSMLSANPADQLTQLALSDGSLQVVYDAQVRCPMAGPSATNPNDFYSVPPSAGPGNPAGLTKLTRTSSGTFESAPLGGSAQMVQGGCSAGAVRTSEHLFLSDSGTSSAAGANPELVDVANDVVTTHAIPTLSSVSRTEGCESTVFSMGTDAAGNSGIVAYDIASASFSTLVTPGLYQLSEMEVSASCQVFFWGKRSSDGAMVLAHIPAGATEVSVLSTQLTDVGQIQPLE